MLANEGGKFTSTLTPERLRAIKPALRVAFSNNFQTCCVEPRPCAIVAPIDSSESTTFSSNSIIRAPITYLALYFAAGHRHTNTNFGPNRFLQQLQHLASRLATRIYSLDDIDSSTARQLDSSHQELIKSSSVAQQAADRQHPSSLHMTMTNSIWY